MTHNLIHDVATRHANGTPLLHVRFAGRSFDLRQADLDVGRATEDRQVKQALASHLEIPVGRLADYVIDRHPNGNITIRPEAVFG